ncbi:Uncharacterised protein [Streptococcus pneumoniae]|nr:Uncharacterised protein [Streptococcus pneumoniae]VRO35495.1 Uncharacterised protein [Streptococcus pneumoniae]
MLPAATCFKASAATALTFLGAVTAALICSALGVPFAATVTSETVGAWCAETVVVKVRSLLSPAPLPALALAVIVRLPEILSAGTVTVTLPVVSSFLITKSESAGAVQVPS